VPALVASDRPAPGVALLTLIRPERRNALSVALRDELCDHLADLAADTGCKVVVITGAGPVFSSGFDLAEFERATGDAEFAERLWASADRYHHALAAFPLVTIAAINGPAIAGGFDLAVMCDLRVAASTARFAHPEHAFGDVVYAPLRDLVGGGLARDLCFTGRELGADEALAAHLVSAVVPPDHVVLQALELAGRVAAAPRDTILGNKARVTARSRIVGTGPDGGLAL